ncbi:MAG: 2-oxoacid:acceptor oxidoreductase family protein [Candidatus Brocadiales bacterium]
MYQDLIISGFGGQGILAIGRLLAYAAMSEEKYVTFLPSYGPIMRGGTANCTVVVSSKPVGSPIVRNPRFAILMNVPSVVSFEERVKTGGLVLYNSDLVDKTNSNREDVDKVFIPANKLAEEMGSGRVANMVLTGAFIEITSIVALESAVRCLGEIVSEKHIDLMHADEAALRKGSVFARDGVLEKRQ